MGTWPFFGGQTPLRLLLVVSVSGKESKVMSLRNEPSCAHAYLMYDLGEVTLWA